ncbi:MAG: hypothetical protein WDN69_22765 [Aliidongia sp.]
MHAALPLLRQVAALHEQGRVAALTLADLGQDASGILMLRTPEGVALQLDLAAVDRVQPRPGSALSLIGESRVTNDAATGLGVEELTASDDESLIAKPVYLPNLAAWETTLGHHDPLTDIFQLGLALACLACGLDPASPADIRQFAANRTNLFRVNRRLHPVVAGIIAEMTALNRHERATDLPALIRRLESYRDQPVALDLERLLADAEGAANRRTAVMSHLRDRLFDLSRRNKLVHFQPTQGTVNLTVASVPLVLRLDSIRSDQLATWQGRLRRGGSRRRPYQPQSVAPLRGSALSAGRARPTDPRDETQPGRIRRFLAPPGRRLSALAQSQGGAGGSHHSPLLWLPVELVKRKGVRDQYMLTCPDTRPSSTRRSATICAASTTSACLRPLISRRNTLDAVHADLAAQIHASEPGVELRLLTRPSIELVHEKAVRRIRQFERRRRPLRAPGELAKPAFSYERDDYRPLGLALFRLHVQPSPLPLRAAVGALPEPRRLRMAPAEAIEHTTFVLGSDKGHRYAWDLDLSQVTLANFNYQKVSLVRDYTQLLADAPPLPSFDSIFSIEPRPLDAEPASPTPIAEQWQVVQSDATQRAAIDVARTGRSFIIQVRPAPANPRLLPI